MGFFDSLIGFAPYAEGMVQRHDQRALQTLAQQRQAMLDKQNADLAQANVGHLNAETKALGVPKPDPVAVKNQEYQYTLDHPKPVPQKPQAMGRIFDPVTGRYTFYDPTKPPPQIDVTPVVKPDPVKIHAANRKFDVEHPLPTQPDRTLVQTGDPENPTGPAVLTPRGQAAGLHVPTKPTAQGGGGQSLAPEDRQKMLNQAKIDNATMKAYENKVMQSGQAPGFAAGAAGIAASAAPTGIVGGIAGLIGNKATGAIDPDYQRYITAQRSYGRIMGNLQSKRYTDHQAEIERSISGLQGNDLNTTIQYKQQLRDASLAGDDTAPTAAPKSGAKPSGPIDLGASSGPAKPQSYEEWKKSKGITP